MHVTSNLWAMTGVAGLVIWLFGGLLSAVSYSSALRPRRHYTEFVTSALFVTGGIMEAAMAIGIVVQSLAD
ncbi:hypothetical protein ACI2J4_11080 [Agrobacterium tumefaciens]|uniref:hypothetical protein n=1 Tax=Agrobacterium tumefaciens TaxID=358 RepID=UPI00384FFF1C